MPDDKEPLFAAGVGKWLIAGAILSFSIGAGLFATIAQTKSGDPIPVDAAAHDYVHDAG